MFISLCLCHFGLWLITYSIGSLGPQPKILSPFVSMGLMTHWKSGLKYLKLCMHIIFDLILNTINQTFLIHVSL